MKIRYIFTKEDDFLKLLETFERYMERDKARIRDLEESLRLYKMDGSQAGKKLEYVRENLRKLLRGLFTLLC